MIVPNRVPLFPLKHVVLFPHVVLPLHLFEARYRTMATDSIRGEGCIAMALLQAGAEPLYHTHNAPIHQVICVGKVIASEQLIDGTFNILLQGVTRATITSESQDRPYRVATIKPLSPPAAPSNIEAQEKSAQLRALCMNQPNADAAQKAVWSRLFDGRVPLDALTDLIASDLPTGVEFQQALLAQPDPLQRADMIIRSLDCAAAVRAARQRRMTANYHSLN